MLQLEKENYYHPGDRTKKIESAKEIFSNIIKRIPPES